MPLFQGPFFRALASSPLASPQPCGLPRWNQKFPEYTDSKESPKKEKDHARVVDWKLKSNNLPSGLILDCSEGSNSIPTRSRPAVYIAASCTVSPVCHPSDLNNAAYLKQAPAGEAKRNSRSKHRGGGHEPLIAPPSPQANQGHVLSVTSCNSIFQVFATTTNPCPLHAHASCMFHGRAF